MKAYECILVLTKTLKLYIYIFQNSITLALNISYTIPVILLWNHPNSYTLSMCIISPQISVKISVSAHISIEKRIKRGIERYRKKEGERENEGEREKEGENESEGK